MDVETLAEVLGNLRGLDMNDPAEWETLLNDAQAEFDDAAALPDNYKWWEDASR